MKLIRSFILGSILLICTSRSYGQFSIQLYPANELTLAARDLWNCVVTNSSNSPIKVYLRGTITEQTSGLVYDVMSATFDLMPGATNFNTANNEQLKPETVLYQVNSYIDYVTRTNSLPRGEYTFCAYVVDAGQLNTLASDCFDASVTTTTPPITISPAEGDSLCTPNPFFIWTPPQPILSGPDVSYTLKVYERFEMQSPEVAVLQNPAWYVQSNLASPIAQYNIAARPFVPGKNYAWIVEAYEGKSLAAVSNIGSFTFISCDEPIDSTEETTTVVKGKYLLVQERSAYTAQVNETPFLIKYISYQPAGQVLMRLEDVNNTVIGENTLDIIPGNNYISIDADNWNLAKDKYYTLLMINSSGEISQLHFFYK